MTALEAVNTSIWAMASHPNGRQITGGLMHNGNQGFTVAIPFIELFLEFSEDDLTEALEELGINDTAWYPLPDNGLYEVIEV